MKPLNIGLILGEYWFTNIYKMKKNDLINIPFVSYINFINLIRCFPSLFTETFPLILGH